MKTLQELAAHYGMSARMAQCLLEIQQAGYDHGKAGRKLSAGEFYDEIGITIDCAAGTTGLGTKDVMALYTAAKREGAASAGRPTKLSAADARKVRNREQQMQALYAAASKP